MKSIKNYNRIEQLERALLIIDGLCLEHMDLDTKLINQIYRVAHSSHSFCNYPHKDWLDEIEKLQISLKEAKIVDCDKQINKKYKENANRTL